MRGRRHGARLISLAAVLTLVALAMSGCKGRHSPTAPEAPFESGYAHATAFENIPVVRALQNKLAPGYLLTRIMDEVDRTGHTSPGNASVYLFSGLEGNAEVWYLWYVEYDGTAHVQGPMPPDEVYSRVDLGPYLQVDSDEAVAKALAYGGQRYLDKFPNPQITTTYGYFAQRAYCEIYFDEVEPKYDTCGGVTIDIDASTGELLSRDLTCAN